MRKRLLTILLFFVISMSSCGMSLFPIKLPETDIRINWDYPAEKLSEVHFIIDIDENNNIRRYETSDTTILIRDWCTKVTSGNAKCSIIAKRNNCEDDKCESEGVEISINETNMCNQ